MGLQNKAILRYVAIENEILKAIENGLGWYFPMMDLLILVPTPKWSFDQDNRLHNEVGAAVDWGTENKFYFWHGVRVSESIILRPETITSEAILKERNSEIRQVMLDRYGPERFVADVGAETLDERPDYRQRLLRINKASPPIVFVEMRDFSSDRIYIRRVHPDTKTCQEAMERSYPALGGQKYNPDRTAYIKS